MPPAAVDVRADDWAAAQHLAALAMAAGEELEEGEEGGHGGSGESQDPEKLPSTVALLHLIFLSCLHPLQEEDGLHRWAALQACRSWRGSWGWWTRLGCK